MFSICFKNKGLLSCTECCFNESVNYGMIDLLTDKLHCTAMWLLCRRWRWVKKKKSTLTQNFLPFSIHSLLNCLPAFSSKGQGGSRTAKTPSGNIVKFSLDFKHEECLKQNKHLKQQQKKEMMDVRDRCWPERQTAPVATVFLGLVDFLVLWTHRYVLTVIIVTAIQSEKHCRITKIRGTLRFVFSFLGY